MTERATIRLVVLLTFIVTTGCAHSLDRVEPGTRKGYVEFYKAGWRGGMLPRAIDIMKVFDVQTREACEAISERGQRVARPVWNAANKCVLRLPGLGEQGFAIYDKLRIAQPPGIHTFAIRPLADEGPWKVVQVQIIDKMLTPVKLELVYLSAAPTSKGTGVRFDMLVTVEAPASVP